MTLEARSKTQSSSLPEPDPHPRSLPVVNSYTEWDLLEEVIVGVVEDSCWPPWHPMLSATMPEQHHEHFRNHGGEAVDGELLAAAARELDEFVRILEREGVTVRRPDRIAHGRPFKTQEWDSASGLYGAMPRDVLLVIGDELIEAPMAWRCRYFEVNAYRSLLKEYFRQGARWTAAPRPVLSDQLYDMQYEARPESERPAYVINEFEPTFDAADFVRFGGDIFVQRSNVTNAFGIEWLRRHLGPAYRVREVQVDDDHPMHIDATLVPLAPGKLLLNQSRLPVAPPALSGWEVRYAPAPSITGNIPTYMSSAWLSMNLLSLDETRVMVERSQEPLARLLRDWGFTVIPCDFQNFNALGGSFHCATLDVRRRGGFAYYAEDVP